jgi:thioredoxin reductase
MMTGGPAGSWARTAAVTLPGMYEVIIVGGGPAGLSAATILGRCRRQVLLCDDGQYRNECSRGLYGFLSRDGIHPAELRRIAREQLERYGIEHRVVHVKDARCIDHGFELSLEDGERVCCRKLLLATGVVDQLPPVEGMQTYFGSGVFHCPYCDGWEARDQPIAAYGKKAAGLAVSLTTWSSDVVLCTDGPARLSAEDTGRLAARKIAVRQKKIARLIGSDQALEQIVFTDGSTLPRRALFVSASQEQRSKLAGVLGCKFTRKGTVQTGKLEGTNIPGLYVAGDASRDVQLAVVAAAEGAKAAIAINTALQEEDGR